MIQKLGSGTYGTVYRPYPIKCSQTRSLTPPRKFIGKVSDKNKGASVSKYKELQNIRKKIDPDEKFTIPLKAICQKDAKNATNPYWKKDGNIEYVFPYGGISYDRLPYTNIRKDEKCIKYLFLSFHPIILGLMEMRKKNVMHMDIKPANLVYNLETNETRLIDYDLMTDVIRFEKEYTIDKVFYGTFYIYWPPEVNLNKNINNASVPPLASWLARMTPLGNKLVSYLQEYYKTDSYKKDEFIPSRFDVYSLGMVWAELFWDTVPEIWSLTKRMIHYDPVKRISVNQLYQEYFKIFNSIAKKITD